MNTLHRLTALAILTLSFPLLAQDKPSDKLDSPAEQTKERLEALRPGGDDAARKGSLHPYIPFDPKITDCAKQSNRMQMADCNMATSQTRTIFLENVSQQNDANEILVAARNMFDPSTKIYMVASQNAITISTWPEQFDRIQAFIKSLDIPRRTYRLTFTIAESDGSKRIGVQHFSVIAADGQRSTTKQGSKVPVATGKYDDGKNGTQEQFTYLDVGTNIDVTPTHTVNGVFLKTKIEESSIAPEVSSLGVQDPIVRQSVFEGTSSLVLGKPLALTQMDLPGSTHHLDVDLMVELIR